MIGTSFAKPFLRDLAGRSFVSGRPTGSVTPATLRKESRESWSNFSKRIGLLAQTVEAGADEDVLVDDPSEEPEDTAGTPDPVASAPTEEPVARVPEAGSELDWARLAEHFEARNRPADTAEPKADRDEDAVANDVEPSERFALDANPRTSSSEETASQPPDAFEADPERFFDDVYALPLRRMVLSIVENEGPMTLRRLARRVAQEHGWQRTGKRIQARVEKNLGRVERHTEFGTTFVWSPGSHSNRVPFRGLDDRAIAGGVPRGDCVCH